MIRSGRGATETNGSAVAAVSIAHRGAPVVDEDPHKLTAVGGLAALSLDALSSVTYGPEAVVLALIAGGVTAVLRLAGDHRDRGAAVGAGHLLPASERGTPTAAAPTQSRKVPRAWLRAAGGQQPGSGLRVTGAVSLAAGAASLGS